MLTDSIKTPIATYRLQLHRDFTFDAAAELADYFQEMGISHLYVSPCLQASSGSMHGYDVIDHRRVNPELGGAEGFMKLCRILDERGIGIVMDLVPNHMAADPENYLWWDMLEKGPMSRFAHFFDVDWEGAEGGLKGKILLPILEDYYGRVLEAGKIRVQRDGADYRVVYFDHVFPLSAESMKFILSQAAFGAQSDELTFIAESLGALPQDSEHRRRNLEVLKTQIKRLCRESPRMVQEIDKVLIRINENVDLLDTILTLQYYKPAHFRSAATRINYRRFFNVSTLIGLAIERQDVFDEAHQVVREWLDTGMLDGLRIDHPDGLRDPEDYFRRLRQLAPRVWIVVEKILEPEETLPESWLVQGTTGYDFLNRVNGVFVDPAGEKPLTEFYRSFTGETADYATIVREKKHHVLKTMFVGEVNRLTHLLVEIAGDLRQYQDFSRSELRDALVELIACFPVYRTYVQADRGQVSANDRRFVIQAVQKARTFRPDIEFPILEFIQHLCLLDVRGPKPSDFVMRFQQFTGPAMAKGVEDTAFYCYNRFMSLNEVGGDPGRFGISIDEFHRECQFLHTLWPETMITLSTHDTKRSEDVRARLNLLSEIPDRWLEAVTRWSQINQKYRTDEMLDRNTEYLFYQNLVGAWPISLERMLAYMTKAVHEARVFTSWTRVNRPYEDALEGFVRSVYADVAFIRDLEDFVGYLARPGRINSLAQTLIKYTAPGVPDLYQGTEIEDLSLVDPDNRRPIDYDLRRTLLAKVKSMNARQAMDKIDQGAAKLFVIYRILQLRRRRPDLLGPFADYRRIEVRGSRRDHIVAFCRGEGLITVVPRWGLKMSADWNDTAIEAAPGLWRNPLTDEDIVGGKIEVSRLFETFPVAVLVRQTEKEQHTNG
jgi:(1->4)-alpha-D-glucan 1-alpha-D-glucosylmutase